MLICYAIKNENNYHIFKGYQIPNRFWNLIVALKDEDKYKENFIYEVAPTEILGVHKMDN